MWSTTTKNGITRSVTRDVRLTISVIIVAGAWGIAAGTPLAVLGAIGRAARSGAIVKGGRHLAALWGVDIVTLDKNGNGDARRTLGRVAIRNAQLYLFRCSSANRSGSLEILMSPSNGLSSAKTRNIAAETDTAEMKSADTTVVLRGANRPKLANVTLSQKITAIRNGPGIVPAAASRTRHRVLTIS